MTELSISPSIRTHSSINRQVLRCPRELSFAASISIVEPFLKIYFTVSFVFLDWPRSQLISLSSAGIREHISSILETVIEAACSFVLLS
nr:MAG TPA: hypothetical protein [Caudoviricetes sp.]